VNFDDNIVSQVFKVNKIKSIKITVKSINLEDYASLSVKSAESGGKEFPMKYVCPCGYEYDPALGDPDNGIAPGTAWEDLPEDWVCPTCGLDKDAFEKED